MSKRKKNALISVYNKDGIVEFAKRLILLGYRIFSSGGTADMLKKAGIKVTNVSRLVGGGAILGHRVVTISRELHAGLLANKFSEADMLELQSLGLRVFDLVCVDCYPLKQEIAKPNAIFEMVIEKTDIGGPLILRSAIKGDRIALCDSRDRMEVIEWLEAGQPDELTFIRTLAAKAETYVADYVLTSAMYRGGGKYYGFIGEKVCDVRYGENPQQKSAGLFKTFNADNDSLALYNFKQIAGEFGYVNFTDLDRMLQTITHIMAGYHKNHLWHNMGMNELDLPCVALGVKHGNCCGATIASTPIQALADMLDGNLLSIFGGAIITNFPITKELASMISYFHSGSVRRIMDVVVAPSITEDAQTILNRKNAACKMAVNPALSLLGPNCLSKEPLMRKVRGGFLVQQNYDFVLDLNAASLKRYGDDFAPAGQTRIDMVLASAICATSNSNTITLVKNGKLIGNGVGQQDRKECCELAVKRADDADHSTKRAVACSDSFFPFPDGPKILIQAGVKTILSLSGSLKDNLTIDLCKKENVSLIMMPNAEARMFFNH